MAKLTLDETKEYFIKTVYHNKPEHMDESTISTLTACVNLINAYEECNYTSAIFELEHGEVLKFKGTDFILEGENIKKHLENCAMVLCFVATCGYEIDKLISINQVRDITFSYFLDACAGLLIEKVCEQIQNTALDNVAPKGYYITSRYSCGYGDFPLSSQSEIVSLLKADKKLGVVVSEGNMMKPTKTVSALIGIGRKVVFERVKCVNCPKKNTCSGGLCSD